MRNEIEGGYSWTLVRRLDESSPRYLQRLSQVANCNSKIAVAFNVMDECFLPVTDQRTGIDLIHNVIYNCGYVSSSSVGTFESLSYVHDLQVST